MRQYHVLILCLLLGFSHGCTNYLYTGKIMEQDSFDVNRAMILYWSKTDPLLGSPKAGPATLVTQCSLRRLSFDEREQGILFLGDPGKDFDALREIPVPSQDYVCGRFIDEAAFVDISKGSLSLSVFCRPEIDEFSVRPKNQGYLKARKEPYIFDIQETKEWSFLGKILEAPPPPQCLNSL